MKKRKEEIFLGIGILFSVLLLNGCAGKKEETAAFTQRTDFTEKEQNFIAAYQDIIASGAISEDQPVSEDEFETSDFEIVLLDEKLYGTPAFSFLPIASRELTEEELTGLAAAYRKAAPEVILQDYSSYKEGSAEERGVDSNRPLTSKEYFKSRISLLSEYLVDGRRPENTEEPFREKGDPLYFSMPDTSGIWIYPKEGMSDEQLLLLIDRQYADVPAEMYTPKEGQLKKADAEAAARELAAGYITKDRISDIYLLYGSGSVGMRSIPDYWTAYIHMNGKTPDYYLQLQADTGKLMEWRKYPADFYSETGFSNEKLSDDSAVGSATEEQLEQAAVAYLKNVLKDETQADKVQITVVSNQDTDRLAVLTVKLQDEKLQLSIDKNDFSVSQVMVLE